MWVWGLIGGLALVGFVIGALLYDRASKARCPHCRALTPKSATTCPHCTGKLQEHLQEAGKEEADPEGKQDS